MLRNSQSVQIENYTWNLRHNNSKSLNQISTSNAGYSTNSINDIIYVNVCTTTNITLDGTTIVIDGKSMPDGYLILVAFQTNQTENGIYVFHADGSIRQGFKSSQIIVVQDGNTYYNSIWKNNNITFTIGTDNIYFEKIHPEYINQIDISPVLKHSGGVYTLNLPATLDLPYDGYYECGVVLYYKNYIYTNPPPVYSLLSNIVPDTLTLQGTGYATVLMVDETGYIANGVGSTDKWYANTMRSTPTIIKIAADGSGHRFVTITLTSTIVGITHQDILGGYLKLNYKGIRWAT